MEPVEVVWKLLRVGDVILANHDSPCSNKCQTGSVSEDKLELEIEVAILELPCRHAMRPDAGLGLNFDLMLNDSKSSRQ